MKIDEKIIKYESEEAATYKTGLEGWVSGGRFFGKDEHMARWHGCTHLKCSCGNYVKKGWTKCLSCRHKGEVERYQAMQYKEWDGVEPVCTLNGDKYFFSEADLIDYINDLDDPEDTINLIICEPLEWRQLESDYWSDVMPDDGDRDGELPKELQDAVDSLNKILNTLSPPSYQPGKIRTSYTIKEEDKEIN